MLLPKEKKYVVNTRNRLISDGIQMSLNTRETDRNNNILVIGGSGAGKTFRFVKPQLLQLSTSYVCTDPKGELMRDTNVFMQKNGYDVKCLNLLNADGMKRSTRYNPFKYIQNDTDILKLVNAEYDKKKGKQASINVDDAQKNFDKEQEKYNSLLDKRNEKQKEYDKLMSDNKIREAAVAFVEIDNLNKQNFKIYIYRKIYSFFYDINILMF